MDVQRLIELCFDTLHEFLPNARLTPEHRNNYVGDWLWPMVSQAVRIDSPPPPVWCTAGTLGQGVRLTGTT